MIQSPLEHSMIIIIVQPTFHVHQSIYGHLVQDRIVVPDLTQSCAIALHQDFVDVLRNGVIESNYSLFN